MKVTREAGLGPRNGLCFKWRMAPGEVELEIPAAIVGFRRGCGAKGVFNNSPIERVWGGGA